MLFSLLLVLRCPRNTQHTTLFYEETDKPCPTFADDGSLSIYKSDVKQFLHWLTKAADQGEVLALDTLIPLFLPSIAAPTVYYFMISYMKSNLPMEIVEAARIDGSGEFHTFNYVVLPIMKPALAVQAIFTFVASWNNYFVPALILTSNKKKTLPILIAQLRSADFLKFDMGQVYMLIAIAIMPVIIVYLFLSKFIVAGVALGGVKG